MLKLYCRLFGYSKALGVSRHFCQEKNRMNGNKTKTKPSEDVRVTWSLRGGDRGEQEGPHRSYLHLHYSHWDSHLVETFCLFISCTRQEERKLSHKQLKLQWCVLWWFQCIGKTIIGVYYLSIESSQIYT